MRIAIVGGGLAGLSLAYALRDSNYVVTVLDSAAPREMDLNDLSARSIALSYGSQKILTRFGIWPTLQTYTTAIKTIHISDRGHFGATRIAAEDLSVDALGFSIQAQAVAKTLADSIATSKNINLLFSAMITHINSETGSLDYQINSQTSTLQADLIILADGGQSNLLSIARKEKNYHQTAVVANITLSDEHDNIAYERFTSQGPIALLPLQTNQMALVWTVTSARATELVELSEEDFLTQLQKEFGFRAGRFLAATKRLAYPLQLSVCESPIDNKVLILGNSAHTVHPVAAQGFNLTLRDVAWLAEKLIHPDTPENEIKQILTDYQQQRQADQQRTIDFTDNLISLFSTDLFPLTLLRSAGLALLNNIPPLKKRLAKFAMGYYA